MGPAHSSRVTFKNQAAKGSRAPMAVPLSLRAGFGGAGLEGRKPEHVHMGRGEVTCLLNDLIRLT